MTRCWYPEDTAASHGNLAPGTLVANRLKEILIEVEIRQRMLPQKCFVGVGKPWAVTSQPLQLAGGNQNRDGFAAAGKLDLQPIFCLVHNGWKIGAGLGDGVSF